MSDLKGAEKLKFEKMFVMESGYVLDFSNATFRNFVLDVTNKDIGSSEYDINGTSKANRLRSFWSLESNYLVGKLNLEMLEHWYSYKVNKDHEITSTEKKIYEQCRIIAETLMHDTVVEDLDVFDKKKDDLDFSILANSIKESIENGKPEAALDRLHTFLMRYIRQLCEKHSVDFNPSESLNAVFGKYVRFVVESGKIESQMTEKILKYSINIIEAFNDVRNNKSLAHDNSLLNYQESILIFNNVTSLLKFVDYVESLFCEKENNTQEGDLVMIEEDLPF